MKKGKWLLGTAFIVGAILLIASQVGLIAGSLTWRIILAIFLLALCVGGIARKDYFTALLPAAGIIALFRDEIAIMEGVSTWAIFGAAVLLALGLTILFKEKTKVTVSVSSNINKGETISGENIECSVNFGSGTKYLHSDKLCRAELSCNFGELKIYFDDTQLRPEGATVKVECNFGNTQMFIPKSWNVDNKLSSSLGSIETEGKGGNGDGPLLLLTGEVNGGRILIVYV